MMQMIMAKGHSRIPVHAGSVTNIVGLVLVKNLLTLLPQDETPVRNCTIRKIPRVAEGVPLYDILNDFQKGHSHMAVVVKCNKEKVESVKQNSEQLKVDEIQPPKNFESKSTKSIGSDLSLPLSYLWTEIVDVFGFAFFELLFMKRFPQI
jgi:metal transporter CNNM